jgi:hypothetical protein
MNRPISHLLGGILILSLGASGTTAATAAAHAPGWAARRALSTAHPTIVSSTYVGYRGRPGDTQGAGVAVDTSGHIFVLGMTTAGLAHRAIVVSKYDAGGTKLLYATLLGGDCDQQAGGLALDRTGNAYVTGQYVSKDSSFGTCTVRQALVAKLTPTGAVAYSVRFGRPDLSGSDVGHAIAVDGRGNAYVTGESNLDTGFPTTAGAAQRACTVDCAFVLKVNPAGTLAYSTFLGDGITRGQAIAVDSRGDAYLAGETSSAKFPTTPNAFQPAAAGDASDSTLGTVFVTKLNPTGSALIYSTYLTGQGAAPEQATALAVDAAGHAYVTGETSSLHFPTTENAYSRSLRLAPGVCGQAGGGLCFPHDDAFVAEIDPDPALPARRTLAYATYFGGTLDDIGSGIAVDNAHHVYLTGATRSWDSFPAVDATQPLAGAGSNNPAGAAAWDAFVAELDLGRPAPASLVFSTYLGGSADDIGQGIALDRAGNAYVVGTTTSRDFPLRAARSSMGGGSAAFLVALHMGR